MNQSLWAAWTILTLFVYLMGWEGVAAALAFAGLLAEIRGAFIRKEPGDTLSEFGKPLAVKYPEMPPIIVGYLGWLVWLVIVVVPVSSVQAIEDAAPFDLGVAWLAVWVLFGLVIHFMPGLFRWLPWADR